MRDEVFVRDVAEEFDCIGSCGSDRGEGLLARFQVNEGKRVSGAGEDLGRAAADALRRTGDDGDLHEFKLDQEGHRMQGFRE